jgi:hypothetical protein
MLIPYPKEVIVFFSEPFVRIMAYALIYQVAYYNPVISIFALICVVSLHLDIINLQKPIKKEEYK